MQIINSIKPLWLIDLAQAFNDPKALLDFLELDSKEFEQDIEARKLFALRVPRPFAEKMQKKEPNDPLFSAHAVKAFVKKRSKRPTSAISGKAV